MFNDIIISPILCHRYFDTQYGGFEGVWFVCNEFILEKLSRNMNLSGVKFWFDGILG